MFAAIDVFDWAMVWYKHASDIRYGPSLVRPLSACGFWVRIDLDNRYIR
jgi:hypothetical protein